MSIRESESMREGERVSREKEKRIKIRSKLGAGGAAGPSDGGPLAFLELERFRKKAHGAVTVSATCIANCG